MVDGASATPREFPSRDRRVRGRIRTRCAATDTRGIAVALFPRPGVRGQIRLSAGVGGVTRKLEARMSLGQNGAATRTEGSGRPRRTAS